MRLARRAFAIVVGTLLLVGCGRPPRPTYPIEDPDRALRLLTSMRRTLFGLQAEARVEQRGSEGRIRGTVLLMVVSPASVRFDVLTQFGPAATLTSDGETFELLDQREGTFLEGPACPSNIARFLGVALAPADVTRLLLGDAPVFESATKEIEVIRGGYVVTIYGEDSVQEVEIHIRRGDEDAPPEAQYLRLARTEIFDAEGRSRVRAVFEDHRVVPDPEDEAGRGVAIPFRVRFDDFVHDTTTTVRMKEVELDVEVPEDAFTQARPAGMPYAYAPCEE